jgi:hypothetical protein
VLLSVSTQFLQVRFHCRNPRCGLALKISTDNSRDAFCCRSCERRYYGFHCRVCEAAIPQGTSRRRVCARSKCRYQFKRHPERYFGLRYPSARIAHNARANPIKIGVKIDGKSGRALRIVAGPEVPDVNLRILPVPAPKANRTWQKAERRATRKALIQYATPPVNIIGGYRFSGAPATDPCPASAAPAALVIPIGDGLEIPLFLKRIHDADRVPA